MDQGYSYPVQERKEHNAVNNFPLTFFFHNQGGIHLILEERATL